MGSDRRVLKLVNSNLKYGPATGRFTLRPIGCEGDLDLICAWRNDPVTRDASFDTSIKTRSEMEHTLEHWKGSDPIPPQLMDHDGAPVAFLRFSHPRIGGYDKDSDIEISIHVAPDARRRGVAKAALRCADDKLQRAKFSRIVALVKETNTVSRRLFAGCGYSQVSDMRAPDSDEDVVLIFVRELV